MNEERHDSTESLDAEEEAARERVSEGLGWLAGGAVWLVGMRWVARFAGLINMIVLARIMTPYDYSVVALALAILATLYALSDTSPFLTLIQREEATREHYDTIFTFSLIRNLVIAALIGLTAPVMAAYFEEPVLEFLLYAICLNTIVEGFANPCIAALGRTMNYRSFTLIRAIPRVGSVVIAIALGTTIFPDYRALVCSVVGHAFLFTGLSYYFYPYRPRLSLSRWRDLFSASVGLLGFNLASFAFERIDVFIIARIIGTASVSVFALGAELARLVVTEIAGPITQAMTFGLARLQHDKAELHRQFRLALGVVFLVTCPMAVGIGLVAYPTVRLLFGEQWMAAAPLVEIMWATGLIAIVNMNLMAIKLAMTEQVSMIWAYGAGTIVLVAGMLILGPIYGLEGTAWATLPAFGTVMAVHIYFAYHRMGLTFGGFLKDAIRPLLACGVMALAVRAVEPLTPGIGSTLDAGISVALQAGVGALAFSAAILAIWRLSGAGDGPERKLLDLIAAKVPAVARLAPTSS